MKVNKNIYTIYSGIAIVKNYSGLFLKSYFLLLSIISFSNILLSCYHYGECDKAIQKYYDKIKIKLVPIFN